MSKKSALGMGLSSLFGDQGKENAFDNQVSSLLVDINDLEVNKNQPRKFFDDKKINELAESIKSQGLINPILVNKKNKGKYVIIAGERRYRASKLAGLERVPVIVKNIDEKSILEIALIENIQRDDLGPIEEARACNEILSRTDHSQESLAKALGKSRTYVTNLIRLLKLPEKVIKMIEEGKLSFGHAKVMVGKNNVEEIADHVVKNQLSVRETEELLSEKQAKAKKKRKSQLLKTEDLSSLENIMSEKLAMDLKIRAKSNHSGEVLLKFKNFQELDRILQILNNIKRN